MIRRLSHQPLHLCDLVQLVLEFGELAGRVVVVSQPKLLLEVECLVDGQHRLHLLHGCEQLRLRDGLGASSVPILVGYHSDDLLAPRLGHADDQIVNDPLARQTLDDCAIGTQLPYRLVVLLIGPLALNLCAGHLCQRKVDLLQSHHQLLGPLPDGLLVPVSVAIVLSAFVDGQGQAFDLADLSAVRQEGLLLPLALEQGLLV